MLRTEVGAEYIDGREPLVSYRCEVCLAHDGLPAVVEAVFYALQSI